MEDRVLIISLQPTCPSGKFTRTYITQRLQVPEQKDGHQDVARKIVSWVMGRETGKATTCLAAGPIFKIMHN